jgi:hypothetical protein
VIAQASAERENAACSRQNLTQSAEVDGFLFRAYEHHEDGTACVEVVRNGKVLIRRTDAEHYTLGQPSESDFDTPRIANGVDITGRGHPNMIVSEWTGGAHCCRADYVFELEPEFRLAAQLEGADDDSSHFADLDRNHRYYFLTSDWTFAYWPSSFAGSPSATVVLRFIDDAKGGSYHLALDKMRKPPPGPAKWKEDVATARETFAKDGLEIDGGATVWNPVLNLIYEGHADLAWKFLDEVWPVKFKGKEKWTGDFCSLLKASPYWPDLQGSMGAMPPACAAAKSNPQR